MNLQLLAIGIWEFMLHFDPLLANETCYCTLTKQKEVQKLGISFNKGREEWREGGKARDEWREGKRGLTAILDTVEQGKGEQRE